MLTKNDLKLIGGVVEKIIHETVPQIVENIVEPKFEEFAIMMKNRFDEVDEALDQKADRADIIRLENKITSLENRFENRLCRNEDNIRIVKTKLKIA